MSTNSISPLSCCNFTPAHVRRVKTIVQYWKYLPSTNWHSINLCMRTDYLAKDLSTEIAFRLLQQTNREVKLSTSRHVAYINHSQYRIDLVSCSWDIWPAIMDSPPNTTAKICHATMEKIELQDIDYWVCHLLGLMAQKFTFAHLIVC